MPQLLSLCSKLSEPLTCCSYWNLHILKPVRHIHNKRSHHNEKPIHCKYRVAPSRCNKRKPRCSKEDVVQPKKKSSRKELLTLKKKKKELLFCFLKAVGFKIIPAASLVAQGWRIRPPMQETWVWSLVWKDLTHRGATKPVRLNYWACAPTAIREAFATRSLCTAARQELPLTATRESPCTAAKILHNEKLKMIPIHWNPNTYQVMCKIHFISDIPRKKSRL